MEEAFAKEESQDLSLQIPWNDVQLKNSVGFILP